MSIEHFDARTIDEALFMLNKYGEEAKIIAGGTDLISLIKGRVISPKILVNIKTIPGLAGIQDDAEGIKIGVLTTIHDIEASPIIRGKCKMFADAAHSVGSPQLRNMGTIGGNLCQDVRCWYYRRSPVTGNSFFCYRKGGKRCYALAGENAEHAIMGGNKCFAVCPSDIATVLLALDAKVRIVGPTDQRMVGVEEFYTVLGNIMKPNEMITEIRIPTLQPDTKQRYLKFRLRKAIDFALSSVATAITIKAGVVSNIRIVFGGVAPIPYRALKAEETIKGKVITESLAETAVKGALIEATPLSKNAYKMVIMESLAKRAIVE
jgi:xanthine dehydrogenase YagS FAD-binding subunit